MTQELQTVRDDLAFIKALAQEGRRAPLLSGRFLLSAGLVYSATSLIAWAIATRLIAVSYVWLTPLWIGVTIAFVMWTRFASACRSGKPGMSAVNNRAVTATWQGLGFTMISMLAAVVIISSILKTSIVYSVFPSLVLAVYGMAWWLAAAMSDLKWIRWLSITCFITAVLICFLINTTSLYLAFAAALLLLLALPGWLLMRAEPSDIV